MKKNLLLSSLMLSSIIISSASTSSHSLVNDKDKLQLILAPAEKKTFNTTPDLTFAAEKAINSVVYIKVIVEGESRTINYQDPFEDFFGNFFGNPNTQRNQQKTYKEPDRKGAGSGVILTQDGYIVTNNHVVGNASQITVKLNDNREFKARIIGTDKNSDLALIKIEAKNLQPITIGNSDLLKVGEWVLAIGNPFSLTSTVTAGIVSAKARTTGGNQVESSIQTDAAINPGNSGGALVNTSGQLVGINNMIFSETGVFSGYGFAIPTSIMLKVVQDLKQYGTVQRALLGIQGIDVGAYIDKEKESGKDLDLGTTEGFYINDVSANGAAETSGLKKGDIIIKIDNKTITKYGELQEILSYHKPGDLIKIEYIRNKKHFSTSLILKNEQGTTKALETIDNTKLGIELRPLSKNELSELNLQYGVVVQSIKNGKCKDAGITKGIIITRVNDTETKSLEDFYNAVKKANLSKERILWIRAKTQSGINKSFTVDLTSNKTK